MDTRAPLAQGAGRDYREESGDWHIPRMVLGPPGMGCLGRSGATLAADSASADGRDPSGDSWHQLLEMVSRPAVPDRGGGGGEEVDTRAPLAQGAGRDSVASVAIAADGRITTGSADQTAKIWSANGATGLATLEGHRDSVTSIAFAADGRLATGSLDNAAEI